MKISEVTELLEQKKAEQARLKSELDSTAKTLSVRRVDYEQAVRSGEAEANLDEMDEEIVKLDRALVRIQIRLTQCGEEIEQLQRQREDAHAEEERQNYETDAREAHREAEAIENLVQDLMARAAVHDQRLQRMHKYCESIGVSQIPFRLKHAERRITAIFSGNHSSSAAYKQPYPAILAGNIESVERQIGRTSPSSGAMAASEAEQQSAAN